MDDVVIECVELTKHYRKLCGETMSLRDKIYDLQEKLAGIELLRGTAWKKLRDKCHGLTEKQCREVITATNNL